jgi:hypothetical protein
MSLPRFKLGESRMRARSFTAGTNPLDNMELLTVSSTLRQAVSMWLRQQWL